MRFIGNKENIIEKIDSLLISKNVFGSIIFDTFAGTSSVGRYYKKKGYTVLSSDLLYFSYCLQRAYLVNNDYPRFFGIKNLLQDSGYGFFDDIFDRVINYLNNCTPIKGFIYNNYSPGGTQKLRIPRKFLTDENAKKIDAIRTKINEWFNEGLLAEDEYFILLASLLESVSFYTNVSGVYAAFQKTWDPRALKPFTLKKIEIIESEFDHKAFNADSTQIINKFEVDIIYLDPPYNHRQYAPNYHLLETIAKYDNPEIKGVAGLRDYTKEKSLFCNQKSALQELKKIVEEARYKFLVLSYNSEGLMEKEDILSILEQFGETSLIEFEYTRFKSNNNGIARTQKYIKEQLYILKRY